MARTTPGGPGPRRPDSRGPDIYEPTTVIREIYTMRAQVRSGNRADPLIYTNGWCSA